MFTIFKTQNVPLDTDNAVLTTRPVIISAKSKYFLLKMRKRLVFVDFFLKFSSKSF